MTVAEFMDQDKRFETIPDTYGRHRVFSIDGKAIAFLWFKFVLGGWRMTIHGHKIEWQERGPIETVEKLKKELDI